VSGAGLGVALRTPLPDGPGAVRPAWWPFAAVAAASAAMAVGFGWGSGPLLVGAAAAVLARFRPVGALAIAVVAVLVAVVLAASGVPDVAPPWYLSAVPAQLVVAFAVAVALPARPAAAAVGALASAGLVFAVVVERLPAGLTICLLWASALAAAALTGARRRDRVRQAGLRASAAVRGRMREEHDRLARELHDVVAHQLSELMARAVSAPHRLPAMPAAAAAEFTDLGGLARAAMGGMRQVLGVLRGDEPPQPGLAELPALFAAARRSGAVVRAEIDPPPGLDAVTGLTVYRIVQEALTNVTRHAGGAATTVRVWPDAEVLRLEIENDPPAGPVPPAPGAGLGLVGMGERVRLLGGLLAAGPRADGGFAVRAELPVGPT
jgi:signal transduction histidine kinase